MKSIKIIALLLCTTVAAFAQQVTVKGNTKLNVDFAKYKTYSWAQSDETVVADGAYEIRTYTEERVVPTTTTRTTKSGNTTKTTTVTKPEHYVYSYNVIIPATNAAINTSIQRSIGEELQARGYRVNDVSPDLLIAYRVLDRQAKIKGYVNDVPTVVNGGTEVRTPQDTATFITEPGTLFISLIDKKSSEVVWDGFASGLAQDNVFTTDELRVKEAIHLIFEQFKHRADKVKPAN